MNTNEQIADTLLAMAGRINQIQAQLDAQHSAIVYLAGHIGISEEKTEFALARTTALLHQALLEKCEDLSPGLAAQMDTRIAPEFGAFL